VLVVLAALILAGCGQPIGTAPPATPADFPGIAGVLARRGIAVRDIVSGDAGCKDEELARTAIRFTASGLDQPEAVTLRVYIFRNREAYDRRRSSVNTCALGWSRSPDALVSIDASPFVLMGQGPVGSAFAAALRSGMVEAAGATPSRPPAKGEARQAALG
jgi:hypothetical protein